MHVDGAARDIPSHGEFPHKGQKMLHVLRPGNQNDRRTQ